MSAAPHLSLAGIDEVEPYPLATDLRLTGHYFTMLMHDRWLYSSLRLKASLPVRAAALDLFLLAQKQAPVGTLPADDGELAALLLLTEGEWRKLRAEEPSPLYHWRPCVTDTGAHRLMHPVVLEVAQMTISRRALHARALTEANARKRLQRLRECIEKVGSARLAADPLVVEWVDAWLEENSPGRNRTATQVRLALEAHGKIS